MAARGKKNIKKGTDAYKALQKAKSSNESGATCFNTYLKPSEPN